MNHLTIQQKNIWNLKKYYPDTSIANICGSIIFHDKLNSEVLSTAIHQIIRQQGALRLHIEEVDGEPMQEEVCEDQYNILQVHFSTEDEFHQYAEKRVRKPFRVGGNLLCEFTIAEFADKIGILVCMDHLIADAWTASLMARQIYEAYWNIYNREHSINSVYTYDTAINAEEKYLSSKSFIRDQEYWSEQYSTFPHISSVRPETLPAKVPKAKRLSTVLSKKLSCEIAVFEKKYNYSPAIVFEAAMVVYLSRINRESSIVSIGLTVLNRANRVERCTAGMFVATVPIQIECSPDMSISKLLQCLSAKHMEIFRHQRFPYSEILQNVRDKYSIMGNLYDVMVTYQNAQTKVPADTRWYFNGYSEVPLVIHVDHRDNTGAYTISIDYQTDFFSGTEIELLCDRILNLVEQIVCTSDMIVGSLQIMTEKESQRIIEAFNATKTRHSIQKVDRIINPYMLLQKQASMTPDRIAVMNAGLELSYGKLLTRVDRIAATLSKRGVQAGTKVVIISEPSMDFVSTIYAIIKLGAVFIPVNSQYSGARIRAIVEELECKHIFIASNVLQEEIEGAELLDDLVNAESFGAVHTNRTKKTDLAYIIYTSGTTGNPKGVMITYSCLANYLHHCQDTYWNYDEVLVAPLFTNTSVDLSITTLFYPLSIGGKISVIHGSIDKMIQQIFSDKDINFIKLTPTHMKIANEMFSSFNSELKTVIVGGESLEQDVCCLFLSKSKNAVIFNEYGPTETTVGSSVQKISQISFENNRNHDIDITIGHPISNTQIYILDSKQKPLPVGVAGELCIAGDGVSAGYFNRPELTAEKFIPNPFATPDNAHGKVMYRTGDLARWREDGEVEYLGRIDTQVKLRGLRIELAEIESVMASFEGIQLVAVTDKHDEIGHQYLVGYYTSEEKVKEKDLRQYLKKSLPKYMIPNYFMQLDAMPMTASGKTDRKNLPIPNFTSVAREYVKPTNRQEEVLCHVLKELFQMEQWGITDDFFDMGGDSLRAIEFVANSHAEGVDFALQNVFDYPTVQALVAFITLGQGEVQDYHIKSFEKYNFLLNGNVIDETWIPKKHSLGNILLTGGTGFLGAHIIDEFLKAEDGILYCLVRGGEEHLRDVLHYYFRDKYECLIGTRIQCIVGDITDENLDAFIPDDIQTVIHAAATVKHFGSYDYFRTINVEGTVNIVRCTEKRKARLIYISTVSVSGNSSVDAFDTGRGKDHIFFDEQCIYCGQPLNNVYVKSKLEAECVVYDAMLRGLDASVIRVGNLTNRRSDLKFQLNFDTNAFLTRIKAWLELGYLPDYLLEVYMEFSPVDQTAEGIILIAEYAERQTIFHLNSNRGCSFNKLVPMLNDLGVRMEVLPGEQFDQMLQELVKVQDKEYIYQAFQNDLNEDGKLIYDGNIHIRNDFTIWFMKAVGFEWSDVDQNYIKGYLDYFRNLRYFTI